MENDLEEEMLMHIAAGTDLPTAMAALPRSNDDSQDDLQSKGSAKQVSVAAIVIIAVVTIIVLWIVLR